MQVKVQEKNLAKSDAFHEKNLINSDNYWLIPALDNNLAKSDALFIKIDLITTV
jgi:HKD family nuclease